MNGLKILKIFVLVGVSLFLFVETGRGEERVLALDEAVELALSKNPALKAVDHLVGAANAKVGGARSGLLPRVDVYEGFSRTNNPMQVVGGKLNQERFSAQDYGLRQLNDPGPINNFKTQFVLIQPVFDQGKTWVGISQAKLGRQAVQAEREGVKQEVIFEVIKAYSQAIRAKENLNLAQETEKVAYAHVKLAEDLFQTGQAVKSDVLSAKVRLSEVREMVIQAKNELMIAKAELNKAMGVNQDEGFEVECEIEYSQEGFDLKHLIAEALGQRPEILAMESRVKNGREGVRMAKTNYLPGLSLVAEYDLNDRNEVWGEEGESWMVGGMLQLNLFDGLGSTYKLKEAQAVYNQLVSQKEELMSRIELEVRAAFYQREEADARVKVSREAIILADESLRIVEDRYKVGLSRMIEVLDNEMALTKAKRNFLYALCDRRIARAKLDLARGVLVGGTQ